MPRLIVANVDSDAMCGTDMSPEIHALSSMCCCRLVAMAGPDDLVILPQPVSADFLAYLRRLFGTGPDERNVIVPSRADGELVVLNEDTLNGRDVVEQIRERVGSTEGWTLVAYFADRPVARLATTLGLAVEDRALAVLRSGGAESFNSKVLFRQLAEAVGVPVAAGRLATSAAELGAALVDLLPETGRVIIKQDRNSGGAGNTAVTVGEETELTGAWKVVRAGDEKDDAELHDLATRLWPEIAVQRNTQAVVEAYHHNRRVHYTELYVHGPSRSPEVLNFGEMRMEPTFVGLDMPGENTAAFDLATITGHAVALAAAAGDRGFTGYMNIDSVLTEDDRILFTEINGRMGDCTHLHDVAERLLGPGYLRRHVLLNRNYIEAGGSFTAVVAALDDAGLSFDPETRSGTVLTIDDVERTGVVEYFVVGEDWEAARDIEQRALGALQALR